MPAFDHACRATQGARSYQEDQALVWSPPAEARDDGETALRPPGGELLAVLADGMGGHAGGAVASRTACESFIEAYSRHSGPVRDRLLAGLAAANAAIAETVDRDPTLSGMGSTLVGAAFGAGGVEWVSVGDSPLLLYRRGEVALLNEDHSLAPELDRMAAAGRISAEEARRDPRRHMLRSAVTGDEIELVDLSRRPLVIEPGDYIVLASDGLQTLDCREIARIITAYAADGADAVSAALIRAVEALRDPHQDNATVLTIRPLATGSV
jgi:protein phosphatase